MNAFELHLQDATRHERLGDVTAFIGEDASGQFGLRAHHERLMTVLGPGLCRFRQGAGNWAYVALTGGLLYFVDNRLYLCATRYLRDTDAERLAAALDAELARQHSSRREFRQSLQRLEEEMLKRLWRMPGA